MEKSKKVTIQDVANYANVSVGTIDRVIHNRGKVSPEKKQKIEEAIKKLNFNPNLIARTLALGSRFLVCALIPSAPHSGHYWSIPKDGLEKAENMYRDFGMVVDIFPFHLFDENSFNSQAQKILEQNPDGVIIAPLFVQESLEFVKKLEEKNIPCVFIDSDIPGQKSLTYIGPDVKQSAYIAAKLLNSVVGKENELLILHMVKGYENAAALKRMEAGFIEFFNEKKGDPTRIHKLTINSTNKDVVFRELTKFYIRNQNIKGVFVTNSKAFLVSDFHLTHELDIRVAGYDLVQENINHLKKGGIDYLISQSPQKQGLKAVQSLFELFVYKKEPGKIQNVPLDIIIRENVDFYINFN
ncbi:substrate-binding domain-containing protein [Maribellus maritimus]|uniref:substrate-binding domain-containing protein n=1 Tax=Maribellus maritimus TaxID=2870838 RepID=UPI001EE9B1FB|nr:LacI family DNA-binding transcriptional regulator [Maribellus maritimus]MCG6186730.1 LacI family transcriptional regulator [Maribellus maritimus]